MKFKDYLKQRGSNVLTLAEHEILGIPKNSGYVKKFSEVEISEEMLQRLSEAVQKNIALSGSTVGKVLEATKFYSVEKGHQYLYFMINEIGRTKIGISSDPIKRARAITTGSGMLVKCVCAWDVNEETAFKVEQAILKRFKKNQVFGEWFVEGTVSLERVEDYFRGKQIIVTEVYRDAEFKQEHEFYDTLEFISVKHQTEKAYLFSCEGFDIWIPKSQVYRIDKTKGEIKITKGKLKDFDKINLKET